MRYLLLIYSFLLLACHNEQPVGFKFMTYNIRYSNPGDGPNWWELRKQKVTDLILKHSPDVLGIQEALEIQISQLDSLLEKYTLYGVGRNDGKTAGEYAAIFYNKEKLKLLGSGTFWLSETPEMIGSVGWDASMERICSWVQLEDIASQKKFFVFNAHFDHIGKEARKNSTILIMEKITEITSGKPTVFMGDLNFTPDEPPYLFCLENGFEDSYREVEKSCTYTGFNVKDALCKRIDYIFTNEHFQTRSFFIDDTNDGEYFPSDHLPVIVDAEF